MNDMLIVMRTHTSDWGTGSFDSLELFFCYGGLELGDAAYLIVPQRDRPPVSISDIGFGLERVSWAINKTHSYFDTMIPWVLAGQRDMFDSSRTLALLALCGVQASNKGPGLQFRRFAKILSDQYYDKGISLQVAYYYDYWSQFIKPAVCRDVALFFVQLEIERFINLRVCDMLQLPPPHEETTEAYLNRLVYTCHVDMYKLRHALQQCKL